jgi:hypothetical protein
MKNLFTKLLSVALVGLFGSSAFGAVCITNNWIDPLFSPAVKRALRKELREKKYREQTARDDSFEDYRVIAAYFARPSTDRPFIRFYFQEFQAPNFVEIFRREIPAEDAEKDEKLIELFDLIPECRMEEGDSPSYPRQIQ